MALARLAGSQPHGSSDRSTVRLRLSIVLPIQLILLSLFKYSKLMMSVSIWPSFISQTFMWIFNSHGYSNPTYHEQIMRFHDLHDGHPSTLTITLRCKRLECKTGVIL